MSTINRIEVSNFLNVNGAGEQQSWEPRYRAELFNFRGQSAAVNMTNGAGKTSNADAWLAILTRDPALITRTRLKMAPEKEGIYSHVRIEFLVPSGNAAQQDFLTRDGGQVAGRETWVFGMCGYRSANSVSFYSYCGNLEDVPVATRQAGRVTLLTNREFRQSLKEARRNRLNPPREDWLYDVGLHVSPVSLRRQAAFQKKGGGDKSAELFNFKLRPGESYGATFFYEVVAPELLAGLMDREGEEDEYEFEETVLNSVLDVIRARHQALRRKEELDRVATALEAMQDAAGRARELQAAREAHQRQRQRLSLESALLAQMVCAQPLPAVLTDLPSGALAGRLAAGLALLPGNPELFLQDVVLAPVFGVRPGQLNDLARDGGLGRRAVETLRPVAAATQGGPGPRTRVYSLSEARELAQRRDRYAEGLDRDGLLAALDDLEVWFLDQGGHRDPLRARLYELDADAEQLQRDLDEWAERRVALEAELRGLRDQKTRMEADEAAYRDLQTCGLFEQAELRNPLGTLETVERDYAAARDAVTAFGERRAALGADLVSWETYRQRFPGEASPADAGARLAAERQAAEAALQELEGRIGQLEKSLTDLEAERTELRLAAEGVQQRLRRFQELEPGCERYQELFAGEDPEGLDDRVLQDRAELEAELHSAGLEQQRLTVQVDALAEFRRESGVDSATRWLLAVEAERAQLQGELRDLASRQADLSRRRQALEGAQVAASDASQAALDALDGAGVAYRPLHEIVDQCLLSPERRAQVLSCFSALLFAPVVSDPPAGARAAEILAGAELQVPVLLRDPLMVFAEQSELRELGDGRTVHGLFAGHRSFAVECLLDPSLVEREKARLETELETVAARCGQVRDRLQATAADAPLMRLARRAEAAERDGAEQALQRVTTRLAGLQRRQPVLRRRATPEALSGIRDMQAFLKLGGAEGREQTETERRRLSESLASVDRRLVRGRRQHDDLRDAVPAARNRVQEAFPAAAQALLQGAQRFQEADGPAFMETATVRQRQLQADLERADGRRLQRVHLEAAQRYLEARRREQAGENVNDRIAALEGETSRNDARAEELRQRTVELQGERPPLLAALEALERAAAAATDYHGRFAAAMQEPGDGPAPAELENHPLSGLAEDLREAVAVADPQPVRLAAEKLSEALGALDIDRELEQLRRLGVGLQRSGEAFLAAVGRAGSGEGLSDVEREALGRITDGSGAERVLRMAAEIQAVFDREQALYAEVHAAERESRGQITKRMAYFIRSARDNLELFRRVARKQHTPEGAYFLVRADMIELADAERLVQDIIEALDVEHSARESLLQRGIAGLEDEGQYRSKLRAIVRQEAYRRIFRSPGIRYVNPNIRADGRPRDLDTDLSTGQKTAMSLSWTVRLAEFAIEREAGRSLTRASARRRVRERAQNLLIIDGLFSDLSDEGLIRSAMSGIRDTWGRFQLIGLIHNTKYQNDFDVFPVLLLGKSHGAPGGNCWVSIEDGAPVQPEAAGFGSESVSVAEIRRVPAAAADSGS